MTSTGESVSRGIVVEGWGATPHWGIYAALLMVSTGLLTLEVSLTRFFSFTIWYHFAYLTISVALLGFGSSGTIVAAFPHLLRHDGQRRIVAGLVASSALVVVALVALAVLPIEVADLTKRPLVFSLGLLGYYAAVGVPFLLAGFSISAPFAVYPRLMGRLYFFDLLGAALGCLLVVSLIESVGVPGLIIAAAGFLLAGAGVLSLGGGQRQTGALTVIAAVLVLALSGRLGSLIPIHVTSTKGLANYEQAMKQADSYSQWTPLNRVDASGWDHPSKFQFWLGSGLVKGYRGPIADVARISYDGSNGSNIYSFKGNFDDLAMLDQHLLRTPYLVRDKPNVLVIGVGGGIDMMNAIKQGASHVTGVEIQPKTVYLLKDRLRKFTGGFYDRADVTLIAGEGRHFARKSKQIFDLIQITAVDTFAAQATGAYVLAESYLYTVEAQEDFFARLGGDGLLSMVVGDLVFPDTLPPLAARLSLNGYRALQRRGVAHPEQQLMVVAALSQNGLAQVQEVLVKKAPFSTSELATVKAFAGENGFVVLYAPASGDGVEYPLSVVLGSDEAARQQALESSYFRIDAVYDDDPFFYNVGKWANFSGQRGLLFLFPGSFIGQLVLVMMITQSVLLGAGLIGLPLLRGAREGLQIPGVASYLGYFLGLGIGFMFLEISFVQSFVLFLGGPTYALSVTIFALLLFSSVGSLLSSQFVDRPEQALRRLAAITTILVVIYAMGLSRVFATFLHLELAPRILIAVLVQMPMGLALGMFMPLGIACVSREHPRLVPWAWGINGIGSVAGTTLAVILAMSWGFTVVSLCAACLYAVGTTLLLQAPSTAAATK